MKGKHTELCFPVYLTEGERKCVCVCVCSDLLHFGIEIYVTVGDDELNGLISDVLIRRLHGNSPDEVHPD